MKNVHNLLNRLHLKKKGVFFGFGTSPIADWKIICVSTTILVIISVLVSLYVFFMINKGEIFLAEKPEASSSESLNEKLLERIIEHYRGKASEFERIKSFQTEYPDPSI